MQRRTSRTLTRGIILLLTVVATAFDSGEAGISTECENPHTVVIPLIDDPKTAGTDLESFPWTKAARVTGFIDIGGDRLAEHPTGVSIFYEKEALWIAFRCEGFPGPELKAEITEPDGPVWRDDSVELFLDPGHSHSEFFQLAVNSMGTLYDASGMEASWNSGATAKTTSDTGGWTAVLRLPFSTLGLGQPQTGDVWAANFCRNRSSESRSSWAPVSQTFLTPERFGHIVFGGRDIHPVRLRRVQRATIGENSLSVETGPAPVCFIEGKDNQGNAISKTADKVGEDGDVSYRLDNDKVRQVQITLGDEKGKPLLRFEIPMESPAASHRLAKVREKHDSASETLQRGVFESPGHVPEEALRKMRSVLDEIEPVLRDLEEIVSQREKHTPEHWVQLAEAVPRLEKKVDGPWCYAETVNYFDGEAAPDFAVGLETPMRKVMIRDFPFAGWFEDHYDLSLARNEHEGFQVVVIPFHQDLTNVAVSVSRIRSKTNGEPFLGTVEVSLVGHVRVGQKQPYDVEYRGWWPDPLLSFQQKCDAHMGEHVSFWIDVGTEPETEAGDYEGKISVSADGCREIEVTLKVHVWDFELPEGTHLRNAFTFDLPNVRKIYRQSWSSELARKYYDLILDHRLNIDHLYRKQPEEIELLKYGVERGMNAFNIKYVSKGAAVEKITQILDECVPRLKEAGLFEMAYVYGFDEASEEYFPRIRKLFGEIHRRYPGLKTATTAYDNSFGQRTGLRDVVDIWVPLTPSFDQREAEKLREERKEMWWYICVTPHHPYANWFVEYPAIEARLLAGAMSFKFKTGGFLYYLIDKWVDNREPIASGPYTRWDPSSGENRRGEIACGDGSLICPGPDRPLSTIRLENIRDGLDDYEYLCMLEGLVEAVRKLPSTGKHRDYLEKAEALVGVPDGVVEDLTEYTRDPVQLATFRQQVADLIEEGATLTR